MSHMLAQGGDIDQPAGLAISDITVRATGEDYLF